MSYRQVYDQRFCENCGKPTLHVGQKYQVPLLGYFIVAVLVGIFTFGIGFILIMGLAILHLVANGISSGKEIRCSVCGTNPGVKQKPDLEKLFPRKPQPKQPEPVKVKVQPTYPENLR
jgi:hypothetical protein